MSRADSEAKRLLKEAGITAIPTPVELLAKHVGAKLTFEPFEGDISGMLYRDDSHRTIIGINTTHPRTRQRFTIAHEIGHLVLHKGQPVFVDKLVQVNFRNSITSMGTEKQEIEANAFAAELLMPRDFILGEVQRRLQRQPNLSPETLIGDLARAFGVSTQAMEFRLINLGIYAPQ